tara:strand:- start:1248 stop:1649 length:402 start_codon:yes stop_codon:yes gene_type:complete
MIKQFTKLNVSETREAINKALNSLRETHGINVSLGNISYSDKSFTVKATASIIPTPGIVEPDYVMAWKNGDNMIHGIDSKYLNTIVHVHGEDYKIVGCTSRRSKYTIIVEDKNKKLIKLRSCDVLISIRSIYG